jgi:hypothetical protein
MTTERQALIDELNGYLNFRLAHRILGLGSASGWEIQQFFGAICELEIILAEFGLEPSEEVVALRARLPAARQMRIDAEKEDEQ